LELEVTPRKEQQEAGAVHGEPLSIEPLKGNWIFKGIGSGRGLTERKLDFQGDRIRAGFTERKLDFQGDRIRAGFKGRVPGKSGVGPL